MKSWFEIVKDGLGLYRAIQEKTRPVCSCDKCPLGYNLPKGSEGVKKDLTPDEMIKHQEELFKKNHPKG